VHAAEAGCVRQRGAPGLHALALAAAIGATAGCAVVSTTLHPAPPRDFRRFSTVVMLHGTSMTLHLALPSTPVSETVVVYATGDGGWFGAAVDMFQFIAAQGYRTAGFSSRAFLRIARPPHATLDPRQLAADYAAILADARLALGVPPETRVILAGWSRGAAFAAIAGSEPFLLPQTRGVVAIGLGADENLKVDEDDSDDGPGVSSSGGATPLHPYAHLDRLEPRRCAVIQAEHDDYLPAARALALFGPDTPVRRLYAVPARNHRFSGGHDAFIAALTNALSWVDGADPATD
jgi:Bacterial virulence protein (VirJ)